jgi:hypothetical protein
MTQDRTIKTLLLFCATILILGGLYLARPDYRTSGVLAVRHRHRVANPAGSPGENLLGMVTGGSVWALMRRAFEGVRST